MFKGIIDSISGLFDSSAELVDRTFTSDEEREELKNKLQKIITDGKIKLKELDLEVEKLQFQAHKATTDLKIAETQSPHWITAAWRPICSIGLVIAVTVMIFMAFPVPPEFMALVKYFIVGYTGGRSIEKVATVIKNKVS